MATRAIMALTQPEREALALATWLGMSLAQVARIVGTSVPAVANVLHASEERLRREVGGEVLASRDPGECERRAGILRDGA
ncbi:MAG: sigma-70 family RNA polymerase sigma factor, partial [Actinobacteria bacterium]|nr:sigma-70 family RNA polymerase sigma factor [Actinomycetota bacterium]